MPWKPGQSGNPKGRQKSDDLRELVRAHCPAAITRIIELTRSEDDGVSLRACEALLDRGYGKPAQEIGISYIEKLADAEIRRLVIACAELEGVAIDAETVQ